MEADRLRYEQRPELLDHRRSTGACSLVGVIMPIFKCV